MKAIHNIEPIYDKNSEILILGSMPSKVSRDASFYYAHKQNRFWKILENIFSTQLDTNQDKKEFLLKNHIALWDVIASCDITGSSDSSIKNIKVNDIPQIINNTNIKCIFCTGKTAYNELLKHFTFDIPVLYLSSPSSANASQKLDDLTNEYKQILNFLTLS